MSADTPGDEREETLSVQVQTLHEHLEATAELPIDHRTNRWLGEAEAVARDAATSDIPDAAKRKRVAQVEHLLEEADQTGHDEADAHLEAAREICRAVLEAS